MKQLLLRSFNDPISKILIKNSSLTKIQLETFLIDVSTDRLSKKLLKYDEKARFRLLKSKISRGSFSRTLSQAKKNVIESIYTILLLGYLGVFDDTRLDPYLEIANKLQTYMKSYKEMIRNQVIDGQRSIIQLLRNELENSLKELSKSKSLSRS